MFAAAITPVGINFRMLTHERIREAFGSDFRRRSVAG
jgi:hypothetical protein